MTRLRINTSSFSSIVDNIKQKIIRNHLSNVTIVNSKAILFSFSFYRQGKLFAYFDKNNPMLCELDQIDSIATIDNGFSQQLRHQIKDGFIYDVCQFNDDNILKISIKRNINAFEYEIKHIYFEIIPFCPNLIVTDDKNSILFAMHYNQEHEKRSILLNHQYAPPIKMAADEKSDDITFERLNKLGQKVYQTALNERKKQIFEKLYLQIKSKIKLLKRKIPILEQEVKEGESLLSYQQLGQLCYYQSIDELIQSFAEFNFEYQKELSPIKNAEKCFKLYKKGKNKIIEAQKQIEIANNELNYYQHLLEQINNGNEQDLKQIETIILPHQKIKKQDRKIIKNYQPYYIKIDGATIYFGHNDLQNDHLTFKVAHYKDIFVHIHNYPGAHVIIKTNQLNDSQLKLAGEIALILSNKDAGEIDYCYVKDVKKGNKLGLVYLKQYKTIRLNQVDKNSKEMIKKANRL